jgi:predicted O-methyltransferase YrrM
MPSFTSDWFSPNIPAWDNLFRWINWDRAAPKTVIEIGCYEGRASLWIVDNLLDHEQSRLYCVDVFTGMQQAQSYYRRFLQNVSESPRRSRILVRPAASFEFLTSFAVSGDRADFIYIDGAHRAASVLEDLVLSFRILRPGGVIICDDYLGGDGLKDNVTLASPKIAIDAFTTIFRDRLEIFSGQPLYQLAFRKLRDAHDDDPTSRGLAAGD